MEDAELMNGGTAQETHLFEFRGTTAEYFKIWAVNVTLTVLTLGIYSAWAKVRTRRYFYAHTFLHGANFEYHANPISILVARIIVIAVVIGGGWLAETNFHAPFLYSFILLVFLPFALVRGLSFNARYSSYRNIRFRFHRAYGLPYLLYALLLLGIGVFALPWLARRWHRYKCGRHQLGEMRFKFRAAPIATYIFAVWIVPVTAILCWLIGLGLLSEEDAVHAFSAGNMVLSAISLPLAVYMFFMMQAVLFHTFWSGVGTDNNSKIICKFAPWQFAFVLFVNFWASLLSLGLLHPWAKVRKSRFLAQRMQIVAPPGSLDEITSRRSEEEGALGEEFDAAEGFDFDAGLV